MKVWVIMGNNFPAGVRFSEKEANVFIAQKESEEEKKFLQERGRSRSKHDPRRIYWRCYEFNSEEN